MDLIQNINLSAIILSSIIRLIDFAYKAYLTPLYILYSQIRAKQANRKILVYKSTIIWHIIIKSKSRKMSQTQNSSDQQINISNTTPTTAHWSKEEEIRFTWYLIINMNNVYQEGSTRIKKKFFNLMGKFIGSRTQNQCRTHFNRKIKEKKQINTVESYLLKNIFSCVSCGVNHCQKTIQRIKNYCLSHQKFIQDEQIDQIVEKAGFNLEYLHLKASANRQKQRNSLYQQFGKSKDNQSHIEHNQELEFENQAYFLYFEEN